MPIVFEEKETVFFVGGTGNKDGDPQTGGGCTKDFWGDLKGPDHELSECMANNGKPLSSVLAIIIGCSVVDNGSGKVRIQNIGQSFFPNCIPGLIAVCTFGAYYTGGRYEIIGYDSVNGDYIDIDEDWTNNTTATAIAGGAFVSLQAALDNADADAVTPNDVHILTNKFETFTETYHEIDVDAGGGDQFQGTWKRIIGMDDNGVERINGKYTTIDADNQADSCFVTSGVVNNIEWRHIRTLDAINYGWEFEDASGRHGFRFDWCRSEGCKRAIYSANANTDGIVILDGRYSSDTNEVIYLVCPSVLIDGAVIEVGTNQNLIWLNSSGNVVIRGCVIKGISSSPAGIYVSSSGTPVFTITNNLFYGMDDGITVSGGGSQLVEYGNIYLLATTLSKAINQLSGGVLYSNYSCLWTLLGAPTDSDRWGNAGIGPESIEQGPQFKNASVGDYRLKQLSPCVAMGKRTLGVI